LQEIFGKSYLRMRDIIYSNT